MKLNNIIYALPFALLTACGGDDSTANPDANINSIVSTSSSSAVSNNKPIIEVQGTQQKEYEILKASLDKNKKKWALRNIKSYQYTYRVACFCPEDAGQNKQVTVYDGAVTEAFNVKTSEYLTSEKLTVIYSIDELFNIIDKAISKKAYKIEVNYNEEYGYPEIIDYDGAKNIGDDERTYYMSNLM